MTNEEKIEKGREALRALERGASLLELQGDLALAVFAAHEASDAAPDPHRRGQLAWVGRAFEQALDDDPEGAKDALVEASKFAALALAEGRTMTNRVTFASEDQRYVVTLGDATIGYIYIDPEVNRYFAHTSSGKGHGAFEFFHIARAFLEVLWTSRDVELPVRKSDADA